MADYPIADGAFLRACAELLTQDFQISWYDRFPPATVTAFDHHLAPAAAAGIPESAATLAAHAGVPLAVAVPTTAALASQAPNKSNRRKYRCACNNNVWGKPGLKFVCADCGLPFVDVDQLGAVAPEELPTSIA